MKPRVAYIDTLKFFGLDIAFTGTVFMIAGSYLRKISDIMLKYNKNFKA